MQLPDAEMREKSIQTVAAIKAVRGSAPGRSEDQQEGLCGLKRIRERRGVAEEIQEVNKAK